MSNRHNPAGISAPMAEWTHDDLVTWMAWAVVQGITKGAKLESVVFQFPQAVLSWREAVTKREKAEAAAKRAKRATTS